MALVELSEVETGYLLKCQGYVFPHNSIYPLDKISPLKIVCRLGLKGLAELSEFETEGIYRIMFSLINQFISYSA